MIRAVRDVANSLHKDVQLVLEGEDLTIDTSISDILSKILLHLIKNCVDHGIEAPAERIKHGKTAAGKICVAAKVQSEHVTIEIEDDGGGINGEALKAKALQNNLYTREQIDAFTEDEVNGLIFAAGLSTAAKVTDISGRGVGLSMVKSTIEDAGGSITIHSKLHEGSKFQIRLPVPHSVLISPCLFVKMGRHQMGFQQKEIYRVLRADALEANQLLSLNETRILDLEGELIPVMVLSELIKIPEKYLDLESPPANLLIIQSAARKGKLALLVDDFSDIEDAVIKTILPQVNPQKIYLGATFLDDGRVGLVLDSAGLLNRAQVESREKTVRQIVQDVPLRRYLVFHLNDSRPYAIAQEDIFRIENLPASQLHRSGKEWLALYRGGTLPIVDLNEIVFGEPLPKEKELAIIIVQSSRGLIGFRVARVTDFFEAPPMDVKTIFHEMAVGTVTIEERVITVLASEKLIATAGTARVHQAQL